MAKWKGKRIMGIILGAIFGFILIGIIAAPGFSEGVDKGVKEVTQETPKEEKNKEMTRYDLIDVIREYTKKDYIVVSDYEANIGPNGELFIYAKVKTESSVDGSIVKGLTEAKYEKGKLTYLKVLDTIYVK